MGWGVQPGHTDFGWTATDRQVFVLRAARAAGLLVVALIQTAERKTRVKMEGLLLRRIVKKKKYILHLHSSRIDFLFQVQEVVTCQRCRRRRRRRLRHRCKAHSRG